MHYTCDMKTEASGPGLLQLIPFLYIVILICIYFVSVSKISPELLYLETWNFVHMTSMTSYYVGKKVRAMGPGPLDLFPFIVLAIKFCIFLNNFYTGFQILMKFILHIQLYALHMWYENRGFRARFITVISLFYISLFWYAFILCQFFMSKISPELLYLETWNFVHVTSMTSCIVGKKIRAMGARSLRVISLCCSCY